MEGRKVIEEGACWRIGDGKLVDVWQHQWIKPPIFWLIRLASQDGVSLKVVDLIEQRMRIHFNFCVNHLNIL